MSTKKTKVTIEGVNYDVDLEKAKELGLITLSYNPITTLVPGDVVVTKTGSPVIVIRAECKLTRFGEEDGILWTLAGLNGLEPFSNREGSMYRQGMFSYKGLLEFLNTDYGVVIGNINGVVVTEFNRLINNYEKRKS